MKANAVVALDDYVNAQRNRPDQGRPRRLLPVGAEPEPVPAVRQQAAVVPVHDQQPDDVRQHRHAQEGRASRRSPETWDDFYAAGKAVKEKAGARACTASRSTPRTSTASSTRAAASCSTRRTPRPSTTRSRPSTRSSCSSGWPRTGSVVQLKPGSFDDQNDFAAEKMAHPDPLEHDPAVPRAAGQGQVQVGDVHDPAGRRTTRRRRPSCSARTSPIFKSNADKQQAAWNSSSTSAAPRSPPSGPRSAATCRSARPARTSTRTRASSPRTPSMNGAALDNLPFSLPEPNMVGWQDVRPVDRGRLRVGDRRQDATGRSRPRS